LILIFLTELSGKNGLNGELCVQLKEGGLKVVEMACQKLKFKVACSILWSFLLPFLAGLCDNHVSSLIHNTV